MAHTASSASSALANAFPTILVRVAIEICMQATIFLFLTAFVVIGKNIGHVHGDARKRHEVSHTKFYCYGGEEFAATFPLCA